jgi:hypothetical protein
MIRETAVMSRGPPTPAPTATVTSDPEDAPEADGPDTLVVSVAGCVEVRPEEDAVVDVTLVAKVELEVVVCMPITVTVIGVPTKGVSINHDVYPKDNQN